MLLATERCLVARCFGSVAPKNRNRGRTPKFTELKTETETEDRKNRNFGSVRSSVFGENVPSLRKSNAEIHCGKVIFSDIRHLLANEFVCLAISLIPRCTNSSAHELASLGLAWKPGQSCVWTGPLPGSVTMQVISDLAEVMVMKDC